MEKLSVNELMRERTWLSSLFLGNSDLKDKDKLEAIRAEISKGEVNFEITINGIVTSKGNLEKALSSFVNRAIEPMERRQDKFEKAVEEKAKELLDDKIDDIVSKLYDIKDKVSDVDITLGKELKWYPEDYEETES